MKLFNFNSKKKPAKARSGAKKTQKKKFILSRKQKVIAIVGGVVVLAGFGYTAYSVYSMNDVGAGGCVSNTYKKGAVKTCVKYAQQMLGMSNPSSSFSAAMYKKVEAFQSKYGLTVDGIIGPDTWRKLCSKGVNATAKKNAGCSTPSAAKSWHTLDKLTINKEFIGRQGVGYVNFRTIPGDGDTYRTCITAKSTSSFGASFTFGAEKNRTATASMTEYCSNSYVAKKGQYLEFQVTLWSGGMYVGQARLDVYK